jgi:hypothetical protein
VHRPTTTATATLLVTVAVSALSGCVTAHRLPPPQASPVPSLPSEPRPDGTGGTPIVQAPAREALALIGPPRKPAPSASTAPEPAAPTTASTGSGPAAPAPPPRGKRQAPPERYGPPRGSRPRVDVPPLPENLPTRPPGNSDVCALGHTYGGWGRDTPQAAICKDVYGR